MPTTISLPAETLSLIFELVRSTSDDYWQAQATLCSASLVSRSWRDGAQRELAYEVRLRPRYRHISRGANLPSTAVFYHYAQPWLQSLACRSQRCRVMTLPSRLVDATVDEVVAQCGGLEELSVESWVGWGVLRAPTLSSKLQCNLCSIDLLTKHLHGPQNPHAERLLDRPRRRRRFAPFPPQASHLE